MFKEILNIQPVLDAASAKKMEQDLTSRFSRVAERFGGGLKSVIKGSFLGISLGLISKLLNPIEALETKIKKLFGEGTDVTEMAEKFNTSSGSLKQLQDVATSMGVTPDQFKDLLTKYSAAIEKGREELANPFTERSASTLAVKEFVGEKDIVKSFADFMSSLQAVGAGPATTVNLGRGEVRSRTGAETRQYFEKEIFGEAQTGATRRFMNANVPEVAKSLNEPSIQTLTQAMQKTAGLAAQKRALDVQNQTQDFVAASNKMSGKMVQDMATADKLKLERETKELESYEDLKKAAIAIDKVTGLFTEANTLINKGIGYLSDIVNFTMTLKQSRMFRGIFGKGD